jgi:hypothetical protein
MGSNPTTPTKLEIANFAGSLFACPAAEFRFSLREKRRLNKKIR